MLKPSQLSELKELLEQSQNPIFFYDNDADGLCSFLLLRRFLGKGKGVAIRSYPKLSGSYAKKLKELNADRVFILDKPLISEELVYVFMNFGKWFNTKCIERWRLWFNEKRYHRGIKDYPKNLFGY